MSYEKWASYWHTEYNKANKKAEAAIAEAKKSKERELTAIRLTLKYKKLYDTIETEYHEAESLEDFSDRILDIMEAQEDD